MNKIVLKWGALPPVIALLMMASSAEAQTSSKPARPALAQKAQSVPAAVARRAASASAVYASADPTCTTGRRRLWTDAGWIVRRVTSCH